MQAGWQALAAKVEVVIVKLRSFARRWVEKTGS
jgi:hypothetical protein